MKKLQIKSTFAGTRYDIENEAGDVLCSIDHLSFSGNKMDAKLFAGQLVNAWNNTYGQGIEPAGVPDMLDALISITTEPGYSFLGKKLLNMGNDAINKARPNPTNIPQGKYIIHKGNTEYPETGTLEAVIMGIDQALEDAKALDIDKNIKKSFVAIFEALKLLAQPE